MAEYLSSALVRQPGYIRKGNNIKNVPVPGEIYERYDGACV